MFREKCLIRLKDCASYILVPVHWFGYQPYAKVEYTYYGLLSSGHDEEGYCEWRLTSNSGKLADWLDRNSK